LRLQHQHTIIDQVWWQSPNRDTYFTERYKSFGRYNLIHRRL